MTLRVLQLSRSMIDGGFDYQREITRAFDGKDVDVTTVFQRGVLTAERQREYNGRVVCLDAAAHFVRHAVGRELDRLHAGSPCKIFVHRQAAGMVRRSG